MEPKRSNIRQQGHDLDAPYEPSKPRRMIPPAVLRRLAHESTEGGTATCEMCHTIFSMHYIRYVKLSTFRSGHACVDCVKEHKLVKIK